MDMQNGIYEFSNNLFMRGGFYNYGGTSGIYPIRPTSPTTAAKVIGLNTNRYWDNNELMTEANKGIIY